MNPQHLNDLCLAARRDVSSGQRFPIWGAHLGYAYRERQQHEQQCQPLTRSPPYRHVLPDGCTCVLGDCQRAAFTSAPVDR